MKNLIRYFIFCFYLLAFNKSYGQILGGRENGASSPSEVKPSELSKGAISGDVNLFTGTFNSSYSFGKVSTPSGLSFELTMSYSSNPVGGTEVPFMSGIPYGEGWKLDIPTISVSTELYSKYDETFGGIKEFDFYELKSEGVQHWYAPQINIPGIINERFIFKYRELFTQDMIFVPSKFDKYVEARFNGQTWEVLIDNGTKYYFGKVQANLLNSSNQRANINSWPMSSQYLALNNTICPKYSIACWYCQEIRNQNDPYNQTIGFDYDEYGNFNFYNEFLQPRTQDMLNSSTYYSTGPINNGPSVTHLDGVTFAKDIFLKKITAFVANGAEVESIKLNYETKTIPDYSTGNTVGTFGTLSLSDPYVRRFDSLYSFKTVCSFGIDAVDSGIIHCPIGPIYKNFLGWHRYDHWRSDNLYSSTGPTTVGQELCSFSGSLKPTDPYLAIASYIGAPINANSYSYHRTKIIDPLDLNNIKFKHGFLQSPRIIPFENGSSGELITSGELYEIRTYIHNDNQDGKKFCNFDISLTTGSYNNELHLPSLNDLTEIEPEPSLTHYRSENIFSTFNQAVKWNSIASTQITGNDPRMVTSNFFSMPQLPLEYNGFNIEIGPGNEDLNYDFNGELSPHIPDPQFFCPPTTPNCSVPNTDRAYWDRIYSSDLAASKALKSTDNIPNNFGIGLGWWMMHKLEQYYIDLDITNTTAFNNFNPQAEERFNTWWNYPSGNGCSMPLINCCLWSNHPTRADEHVSLRSTALIRYNKNTFMLSSVDHYKTNGEIGFECADGYVLVSKSELEFSACTLDTRNNVFVSSGNQGVHGYRNLILLTSIKELPVNPTKDPTNNSNGVAAKWIRFNYTKLNPYTMISNYPSNYIKSGSDFMILNEITNQLGGKTNLTYGVSEISSRYLQNMNATWHLLNPYGVTSREHPTAFEVFFYVSKKSISNEAGVNEWNYTFSNRSSEDGSLNFSNTVLLNQQHYTTGVENYQKGFKVASVDEPTINNKRAYTKYYHYVDRHRFGKLSMIDKFNNENLLISRDSIIYSIDTAYSNGIYRNDIDFNSSSNSLKEYSSLYTLAPFNLSNWANNYHLDFPISFGRFDSYPFLEADIDILNTHNEDTLKYLSSFFVRKTFEMHKEFDYKDAPSISILAAQPIGQFTSSSINHFSNLLHTRIVNSISTCKEYTYWDANNYGITSCKGFRNIMDAWIWETANPTSWELVFEPSWSLFSEKTFSPQLDSTYNEVNFYYYFDLLNSFNSEYPYSGAHSRLEDFMEDPGHPNVNQRCDGIGFCRKYGIREICYEKRVKAKSRYTTFEQQHSTYYIYDANNNQNDLDFVGSDNNLAGNNTSCYCPPGGAPQGNGNSIDQVNIGGELSHSFLFRYSVEQASDIFKPEFYTCNRGPTLIGSLPFYYSSYDKSNEPILRWGTASVPSRKSATSLFIQMIPLFPFDTLVTHEVLEYSDFGLVKLERDERNLRTRYYYEPLRVIWNHNNYTNCAYRSLGLINFGVPVAKNVGEGLTDSLHTDYLYYPNFSIYQVNEPNNNSASFYYDNFGRLKSLYKNNNLLSIFDYHQWEGDVNLSFSDRTSQNYLDVKIIDEIGSYAGRVTRSFIDPLGRKYATLSQTSTNCLSNLNPGSLSTIYSGHSDYDSWNRPIKDYKPYETQVGSVNFDLTQVTSSAATQYFNKHNYESNLNSRNIANFDYGESLHSSVNCFSMIDGKKISQELGKVGFASAFEVFRKTTNYDQDRKPIITYQNAVGQKVALKQYSVGGNTAITTFKYDGFGNVVEVLADNGTITTMAYNTLNRQFYKFNTNENHHYYMYNRSGQIVLEEDQNGISQPTNTPAILRKYIYDKFGRLIKQERVKALSSINSYKGPLYIGGSTGPDFYLSSFSNCQYISYIPYYFNANSASSDWLYFYYYNSNNVPTKTEDYNYLLNDPNPIVEKEFFYNESSLNTTQVPISQNINNNYVPLRGNLLGRLSHVLNYDIDATNPAQITLYSYLPDGKIDWEAHEFNPDGITQTNVNTTTLSNVILYPTYDLQSKLKEEQVDIGALGQANQSSFIKYNYQYDLWGQLNLVKFKPFGPSNQFFSANIAQFEYYLNTGKLKNEKHFGLKNYTSGGVTSLCNLEAETYQYFYTIRDQLMQMGSPLGYIALQYYDGYSPYYLYHPDFRVKASSNYNGNINSSEIHLATDHIDVNCSQQDYIPGTFYGYQYDAMNRLTIADASVMGILENLDPFNPNLIQRSFGDESIGYDDVGNIVSLKRGIIDNGNYSVDQMNYTYNYDRLLTAGPHGYTYDYNGNFLSDSYNNILIDKYGRANLPYKETITRSGVAHAIEYIYDCNDTRTYKKDHSNVDNIKDYYLIDQFGNNIGVYNYLDNSNDKWKWYVFGNGKRIAELKGVNLEYYFYDHLGSTLLKYHPELTNTNNVWSVTYDFNDIFEYYPFGKVLREYHSTPQNEKYMISQHERDSETGLDYFGARYYDSDICRFLSVDPYAIKVPSMTPYRIAFNNPILFCDPNGNLDITEAMRTAYPRLSLLIDNIQTIYNGGQISPELQNYLNVNNLKVMNAFSEEGKSVYPENSKMNYTEIQNALELNCGPRVAVGQIDGKEIRPEGKDYGLYDGLSQAIHTENGLRNDSYKDEDGEMHIGYFTIDDCVARNAEYALGNTGVNFFGGLKLSQTQCQEAINLAFCTVMHELGHYGFMLHNTNPIEKEIKEIDRGFGWYNLKRVTPIPINSSIKKD
jgi:RHS repeat-associated protein